MSEGNATIEFLRLLHPGDEGLAPNRLLIWTLPEKTSRWFGTLTEAGAFASKTITEAVYFGLGLAPRDLGPRQRCKSGEIVALPGFGVDLDVAGPVHGKVGLPPTKEDARKILPTDFPPTLIVDSGHGLQAFWLLKELWVLESEGERQRAEALSQRVHRWIEGRAAALGYTVDSVFDLARVFRLVGTLNRKIASDPRPVRLIEFGGPRYNPSDLEQILDLAGIREVQVVKADDSGRVEEFGALHVDPRVELAQALQQKIDALLTNDTAFAQVWNRKRRMPRDSSWSAFALSIANTLAIAGLTEQEIIDVLTVHRREHGDPGKRGAKPLAWFVNPRDPSKGTVGRAMLFAREQAAKEKQRQDRAARKERKEAQEAEERKAIATAEGATEDEARATIQERYGMSVKSLRQIGDNLDPAFRLELQDGRRVEFPSLAAVSSFYTFRRYVWLALGRMLPSSAEKAWPEVATLMGRLKEVEDVGGGSTEMLLHYLSEWLSVGRKEEPFKNKPAESFPEGPLRDDPEIPITYGGVVWATSQQEFVVALKILTMPQRGFGSAFGACWPLPAQGDDVRIRVVFKLPPFVSHLHKMEKSRIEIDAITKLLTGAEFVFRDSPKVAALVAEAGGGSLKFDNDNIRVRRVWAGWISEPRIDEQESVAGRLREDAAVNQATGRVQ